MILILFSILIILLVINNYYKLNKFDLENYSEEDDVKECLDTIDTFRKNWEAEKIRKQKEYDFNVSQAQLQDIDKINAFKDQIVHLQSDTDEANTKYNDLINNKIPVEKSGYEDCQKKLDKENQKLIQPKNCISDNDNQIMSLNNAKQQTQQLINDNNSYTNILNNNLNNKNTELNILKQNIEEVDNKIDTLNGLL